MLLIWFLKRFYSAFFMFLVVLTVLFASGDLLIRLPFITSAFALYAVIVSMLPLMLQLALPLASVLAVSMPIGSLFLDDQILGIRLIQSARKALGKAVIIFSLSIGCGYALLVFEWAPQSYLHGKRVLVNLAQDHITQLEPATFHTIFPGITCFFQNKHTDQHQIMIFEKILLIIKKKEEWYFFSAQQGFFKHNIFSLLNGSLVVTTHQHSHAAQFASAEIDFQPFLSNTLMNAQLHNVKFLALRSLLTQAPNQNDALSEIFKRIAQIIWQFLLPCIVFFMMFGLSSSQSNVLLSVVTSGLLYLIFYASVSCAQGFSGSLFWQCMILIIPLLAALVTSFFLYKKKL